MSRMVPDSTQPLLHHLIELRQRILRGLAVYGLCVGGCYVFSGELFEWLVQPLMVPGDASLIQPQRLIYTGMTEAFLTYLKVACFFGFVMAFPYLAWQIWRFVMPGLYQHERRIFGLILWATPGLFLAGAAFAYYIVFPQAYAFFLGFQTAAVPGHLAIELEPRIAEYLNFVMRLILGFGLSFQMPIVLMVLSLLNIVHAYMLRHYWRFAVVGIFALAAVITPPDIFSMIALALPLLVLYVLSIILVAFIERKRLKKDVPYARHYSDPSVS